MGSIEPVRDDNGRVSGHRARWRDPEGAQHKKLFRLKKQAEQHLADVEVSKSRGSYIDPRAGRETIGTFGEAWFDRQVKWKPKARLSAESLWRARVEPRWGTVALAAVQHSAVEAWVADMRNGGLSASRTRQSYHLLTSILDAAVRDGRIIRNAAADVDLPPLPVTEHRYLTHEQLHRLANRCGEYRLLVLVLGYVGLRYGEAIALKVSSIDLARRRLRVSSSTTDVSGHMVTDTPKGHQARTVPLPRFLAAELAEYVAGRRAGELLFRSPQGAILREQNWRRRCFDAATTHRLGTAEVCAGARQVLLGPMIELGCPDLTPHELRHTAASLAISAGANIKAVQRMLGHKSASMTLDLYGHLFDDDLDDLADRLDAAAQDVPSVCPVDPVRARLALAN